MKKFMIIGAAALMLVSGVAAIAAQPVSESPARTTEASAKTDYVDCKFNCRDFTGLDVSGIVKVTLAKSDFYKVKVTLPEELAEYLDVHVSEGVLRIGWSKNIPSSIQRKLGDRTCTAEVTMPELRKLEMSGATSLSCEDTFELGHRDFSLEMSGASSISSLKVNAEELEAEISGGCSCSISGNFREADLDLAGASNGRFEINADKLEIDASGATKTKVNGEFGKVGVDASGACDVTLTGRTGWFEVDASGACKVNALNFNAQNAVLETSGASSCNVNVERSITIEDVTGASSINYKAPKDLGVNIKSLGRSASLKRVN